MRRRGFTLVELIVVMVVGGVLAAMAIAQFIMGENLFDSFGNKYTTSTDATIAMDHMTRTLRFAIPVPVLPNPPPTISTNQIQATIQGGHLPDIVQDTVVIYTLTNNYFTYQAGNGQPYTIASDITYFNPAWDGTQEFTLQLTATQNNRSTSLKTKVRSLL